MNLIKLALISWLLIAQNLYSQQPEPYFLYLLDWGEGGVSSVNNKLDVIPGIDPVEDGYIFEMTALCQDTALRFCVRHAKIDFSGNLIWNSDLNTSGFNYSSLSGKVENWEIENTFFSFLEFGKSQDSTGLLFSVLEAGNGAKIFERYYLLSQMDSLFGVETVIPFSDSLFLLAGSYPVLPYKFVPALRWIRRPDGALVKSVNVMDVFNNNSNKLESLTLRSDGNFNFSFVRRAIYDDPAGFLYAGVTDTAGNVLSLHFTGDHTGFDFPAFTPMTQEVLFSSGNRFLVSGIDTTLNDELTISNLFKTYYLDEDGSVIKDSLFHFPGDTIYRVTDLDLADNGDVLVAGELFNWTNLLYNTKEIFLMRYNQQGELLWHKTYAPYFFQQYNNRVNVHQVEEDFDGGILITGHIIRALDTLLVSSNRERYGFILKLDPNGCYFQDCDGGFILTDAGEPPVIDLKTPLRLFPNPVIDELNLEFFRPVHGSLRIFDAMGRQCWSGEASGEQSLTIGLGAWAPGIYLLQVEEEGRRYAFKFVVAKR